MIISIATLIFSFVHRMETKKKGLLWIVLSLGLSYLFTIFINGFRIMISIYLPIYLKRTYAVTGYMTAERLHTVIGIILYFTSLFIIYYFADSISSRIANRSSLYRQHFLAWMPPIFWYFFIALGIPFLNQAFRHDNKKFAEYAMLVSMVCVTIVSLFYLASSMRIYRKGK